MGGGGLGEVLQEKEKRALGNKTACILSFFLNRVKRCCPKQGQGFKPSAAHLYPNNHG